MDMYNKNNPSFNQNPNQWGVFASGLALGGIIGASIALLLAPKSGEEVRSLISDKSTDLRDQISGKVDEVRGKAEQQMDTVKQQMGR
jgi:gas vesicle protein